MRIAITPVLTLFLLLLSNCNLYDNKNFNEQRAYQDIEYQLSLGPRTIGSTAHQQFLRWSEEELIKAGWAVELQEFDYNGNQLVNVIATRSGSGQWIILGAHYDSRFLADHDQNPTLWNNPVPGANDGASGVAVLLEIARVLPTDLDKEVWIVFFDAEDNGGIPGWEWIIGSQRFVANLTGIPDAVVIVDMIGDADLNIYREINSSTDLVNEIWNIADDLGYHQFLPDYKYRIYDDHIPFIQAGFQAIDIIDFDYPYYHTTQDTLDKVSPESLDAVGETLLEWLRR